MYIYIYTLLLFPKPIKVLVERKDGKLSYAGATLIHTSTRRPPNAFHFRRQIMILEKAGCGGPAQQFQDLLVMTSFMFYYNMVLLQYAVYGFITMMPS